MILFINRGGDYTKRDLTKGNALNNLIVFSLPFLLSYFLQTFYGMADLLIVGQFNEASSLSAVSIGSQVMHMITVIIVGLAMGSTVMIGRYVGNKNEREISRTIGNTIILFMIVSICMTIILLFFLNGIVSVMSTPVEAVSETRLYLMICFIGIPFITAYNIISSIFRGLGDSRSPMYFVAIACFFNIFLDLLLVGYFDMHAIGAAYATVVSQTLSVMIALIAIIKKKMMIIHRSDLKLKKKIIFDIIKIGIPIACQDGFIQISFLVITMIANTRGVNVSAAVGVVEKIISLLFLVPSSMQAAISAISAQCLGANNHRQASLTLKYGLIIAVGFGLVFFMMCQIIPSQLLSLFTSEVTVITLGVQYLRSYSIDCIMAGVHFSFSGYFTAYGYSMISFIHNTASILLVRIPGAYLASQLFPNTLYPMGLAAPMGSLLSSLICIGVYIYLFRIKKKHLKREA